MVSRPSNGVDTEFPADMRKLNGSANRRSSIMARSSDQASLGEDKRGRTMVGI